MNGKQLSRALEQLADELVPADVDLWPRIRTHFKTSKKHIHTGDLSMGIYLTLSRRLRLAVITVFVLLVVVVLSFLTIPPLKAVAREVLGFSIKTKDIQTIFTPTPVKTVNPTEIPTLMLSVAQQMKATEQQKNPQISPEVEYQIKLPVLLPEGWKMENIEMGMNGNAWVNYVYESGGSGMYMIINPAQDLTGTILGPEGKVEMFTIGNITVEYVRGSWVMNGSHGIRHQVKPTEIKDLTWSDDPIMRKLRWKDGNLIYLLISDGSSPGEPGYVGKTDLAVIAGSCIAAKDGNWPAQQAFTSNNGIDEVGEDISLSPSQLEAQAGYDILEPAFIPENYQYDHGDFYTLGGNGVDLYYICKNVNDPPSGWGLWITQMKMSEAEYQFNMEHSPRNEVGDSAQLETVSIDGVSAEYVKGNWRESLDSKQKIWDNNVNYHKLEWYKDGFLYEIHTGSMAGDDPGICLLTKEDIIAIAESLK
jgi:hypothetical protein